MRASLQTKLGQRLREARKRFRLNPITSGTRAKSRKLRKARASRVKQARVTKMYNDKRNPFMEGGIG